MDRGAAAKNDSRLGKSASKEPKKDKTPPRERDAASKTGSSAGKHGDGNCKDNTTSHKEAEPRRDKDREVQNRKDEQHAMRPTRAAGNSTVSYTHLTLPTKRIV